MFRLCHFVLGKFQTKLFIQPDHGIAHLLFTSSCFNQFMKEKVFTNYSCSSYIEIPNFSLNCRPNIIPGLFHLRKHVQVSYVSPKTCWNCNQVLKGATLFCDSCNSLQPVDKQANLFNIMGINRSYSLNQSELKQKFRNLQTLLHPDKFSSKPKKEQALSEEFSAIVNKAYSTLLDPLERGLYLLSLNNISIEEGTTDVDKMFLMEIMERNEEIENESDPVNLNKFYKVNREQLELLISKVTEAFDKNDIDLAKKLLTEMKYYNTIEKKIKTIKQNLNIPD